MSQCLRKTRHPCCLLQKSLCFHCKSFASYTQNKALRILNLIAPKPPTSTTTRNTHLRLVEKFLQIELDSSVSKQSDNAHNVFDEMHEHAFAENRTFENARYVFDEMREYPFAKDRNFNIASDISNALSLCGSTRDLYGGVQYHCMAIQTGFIANVYIGSCLISLYSKCGDLESAFKVFEEMPVRNVVSWTAMIAGFAQEWQVESCLGIYNQMRDSLLEPNDFTFTSLLSAFTGSGALGHGRSCHCQVVKMGFESYVHVANALISMYGKCGVVEDALQVFRKMRKRDVVSWNSMIAGYSLHGLAEKAVDLFEDMKKRNVKPDSFTFLGVLSSCRHAGLVEEGQMYFNSMIKHGVEPELDHYSCVIDLLGRAGQVKEACDFIKNMPNRPNGVIWGSLLSSCRLHGDVWIGIEAAENRLLLKPNCAATHVQLANLYGSVGYWDKAARVRKMMKHNGLRPNPGYSWIEIGNEVHKFGADNRSNIKVNEILTALGGLVEHMITLGYIPEMQEGEEHNDD